MSLFDIADLSTGFFEAFYTIALYEAFLEHRERLKPWIYYVVAFVLGIAINFSNHLFSTDLLNMVIVITLGFLYSMLYLGSIDIKAIAAIFSFMISSVSEIVILMCMSMAMDGHVTAILSDGILRIIGIILSKGIGSGLAIFFHHKIKREKRYVGSKYWILFLLVLLSIIITTHTFYLVLMEGVERSLRIKIYACTAGVIGTGITMLFLYDKNMRQRAELTEQRIISRSLNERIKYYSEMARSYDKLRSFRHDMKNTLLSVRAQAARGEVDGCIKILDGIIGDSLSSFVYHTGNTGLDAILGAKKDEAEQKGIQFETKLSIPPNLPLADEDICVIFGNALDNAIEACEKLNEHSYIYVLIKHDGKDLLCRIENSCPSDASLTKKTSKPNKHEHGIGIRNIERTLEKYSAVSDAQIHDGAYILSILFENLVGNEKQQ